MSVEIFKDRPLPDHTKLDYQECFAKILLEKYFPQFKNNLHIKDKPDLWDVKNDIGIEVTDIMAQDRKEALKIWYMMPYIEEEKRPRKIERMKQLGVNYSAGIQVWPTIHYDKGLESKPFQELYSAIKKKVKKLNSGNYKIFKRNELLLFSELMFRPYEHLKIIDTLKEIVNEGEIRFDKIYIVTVGKIYYFNFNKNECKEKYIFNQDDLARQARLMVEEAEENE